MDLNGVIQYMATTVPLGYWLIPYAGDALVKIGLIKDDEDEEQTTEEQCTCGNCWGCIIDERAGQL